MVVGSLLISVFVCVCYQLIPYSEKFWRGKILAILPKSRFGEKKFGEWRLQKFYSLLSIAGKSFSLTPRIVLVLISTIWQLDGWLGLDVVPNRHS